MNARELQTYQERTCFKHKIKEKQSINNTIRNLEKYYRIEQLTMAVFYNSFVLLLLLSSQNFQANLKNQKKNMICKISSIDGVHATQQKWQQLFQYQIRRTKTFVVHSCV
eukprot:TRINITY_DN27865_c0_g1_i1.p6 TRINITY_DN27865_c0_g1~~TRINITY_DN27865_c0_g1_i1.p6  ORF type:complete len:110 (-),score=0.11 TRINITY_DN27865_c0_g1_i1:129-458(-)